MDKKLFGLLLILFTLFLSACNGEGSKETNEEMEKTEQKSDSYEYDIVTVTYHEENVAVEYPKIINFHDEGKQETINELIKTAAIKPYQDTIASLDSDQQYEADGSYEIKLKNEEILSIAYRSYNNVTPSAHPYHLFFTTNIELNTGKQLFLTDFVSEIDIDFINTLKEAKYVGDIENEYEQDIRNMAFGLYENDEKLILELTKSQEGMNGIYVYVTEDALGISMPVAHVAGDHAEFEISINDLKGIDR
ncbi:hypothetical protein BC6307_22755 [Sutcliffiella cohnii]|uniref:DUF3298 domain-containing protein n=1 Tax=Sutcliffiella cohnii TaxID=33932 RepID=A0A223KWP4_9BACI|nr:DUF4163 domain-containing protein [Sutcliffiella cohnii]AST93895.1 hypothetical protein BC6307_22755 [Sutcliffiella cohnii]